jgi:hypothetical protein
LIQFLDANNQCSSSLFSNERSRVPVGLQSKIPSALSISIIREVGADTRSK